MNYINFQEKLHLIRHDKFELDEVFSLMLEEDQWGKIKRKERRKFSKFEIKGYPIDLTSHKLVLFKRQSYCACCGLQGQYFYVESLSYEPFSVKKKFKPFLNLYGIKDGIEILLNIDHIIPRSKGGKSCQSNYQTLCYYCNIKKGDKDIRY